MRSRTKLPYFAGVLSFAEGLNGQIDEHTSTGNVEVIATHEGHAVGVQQGKITALCFHPELTRDLRIHRQFLKMAAAS